MARKGKRYANAARSFDRLAEYPPDQAVGLVKSFATTKFDETIDVVFKLNIDARKADQLVRGTVSLDIGDAAIVDRFQLVINGWEVVNAYSELIDPLDQMERFRSQLEARELGDMEAMETDEEFVTCMEYGMPPMSGWGMGIDRFVALLTDTEHLRDVVLFPLLKPEK